MLPLETLLCNVQHLHVISLRVPVQVVDNLGFKLEEGAKAALGIPI
jgi:hypothetical protein